MQKVLDFEQFLIEKSGQVLNTKRNEWVKINPKDHAELADEFFDLIQTAYSEIGGHAKIKTPDDVFADPDWTYWKGVDLHGDPDVDLIIMGAKTKYGLKYTGVGHDGTATSKKEYINGRASDLKKKGYFAEVSGKLASILIKKYNVPIVDKKEDVEKVLGKNIEWKGKPSESDTPGDGWYTRSIGGKKHEKILVGRPNI